MKFFLTITITSVVLIACGCASGPKLVATHSPNPCDVHESKAYPKNPFPFMWYYRTEVRNNSSRPIQITTFEGYSMIEGKWVPNNVLRRKLTSQDFTRWYTEGDQITDGWIQPGGVAACDPNWHGASTPQTARTKWAFTGVDAEGNTYQAEAEIESVPIKQK